MNVSDLRKCSNVRRCHTFPHQGEYTVGKHSYDAVMLLLALNPDASKELMTAVLMHDLGEYWVGDMPCTAHWANPALGVEYRAAEAAAMSQAGIQLPDLSLADNEWLQAVDKLELMLWCEDQIALGVQYAEVVRDRLVRWFQERWSSVPAPVQQYLRNEL